MPYRRFLAPRFWPAWLLLGWMKLATVLPYPWQISAGNCIGLAGRCLTPRSRRVVLRNLETCFPELSPAQRQRLSRQHFAAVGAAFSEMGLGWFASTERLQRLIRVEGREHIEKALAREKGIIVLTAHFTSLETGSSILQELFPGVKAVYRPQPNKMIDAMISRGRQRIVAEQIPKDNIRAMVRTLRDGGAVAYLADLAGRGNNRALVPFFGEPAMTTTAVLESGDSTEYGLGLGLDELGGRTLYWHTGGDISHRAYLGYLPELESGVILMSNNAAFDLSLGEPIARLFFGDELEPEETAEGDERDSEGSMSDERKEAIAGDWVLEVQGLTIPMEVSVEDGEVYIEFTGQDRTAAQTTSDSTVTIAAADATFTFRADPDGNVTSGAATQGGIEMTMRRAEKTALTEADLQGYAGRYFSGELEAFMRIAVEDGGLVLHQLGQTPQPLSQVTGDSFSAEVFHLNEIAFQRAADGSVTGFTVSNGRTRGVLFERM